MLAVFVSGKSAAGPSIRLASLPVGAASRANCENVDHLLLRSPIEEDAPLADAEPPETLRATEAFDIALRKLADC